MNLIWLILLVAGGAMFAATGRAPQITASLFRSAEQAVMFGIKLAGLIAFWSGVIRVAEEAGISRVISRALRPLLAPLFPSLKDHDGVMAGISMAISANILGLANAGTALGLRAMEEMQRVNSVKTRASDAMCTFVIFIMGGLTLIPSTVVALRAQGGSAAPDRNIIPTILVSSMATAVALTVDRLYRRRGGNGVMK